MGVILSSTDTQAPNKNLFRLLNDSSAFPISDTRFSLTRVQISCKRRGILGGFDLGLLDDGFGTSVEFVCEFTVAPASTSGLWNEFS